MIAVRDARGVTVRLPAPPRRIVSLVPSTTETLFALGVGERVVGVTRFCVHPEGARRGRVKVGGTKDLELERLRALQPELVIGNVEENTPAIFAAVEAICPLYAALPRTVDEALEDLLATGRLVGAPEAAASWRARIEAARARLVARRGERRFTYSYLIWRDPWMAAGGDTFISAMLAEAGGINRWARSRERYPALTLDALVAQPEDRVLLSSEPFPFSERHLAELTAAGLDPARLHRVDGEYCSWHGVRMLEAFAYLEDQLERWTAQEGRRARC